MMWRQSCTVDRYLKRNVQKGKQQEQAASHPADDPVGQAPVVLHAHVRGVESASAATVLTHRKAGMPAHLRKIESGSISKTPTQVKKPDQACSSPCRGPATLQARKAAMPVQDNQGSAGQKRRSPCRHQHHPQARSSS